MITAKRTERGAKGRALALGLLLAALVAAMLLVANPAHAASTFTVTNTNDSGTGSLRKAIEDANANNNPTEVDFIDFVIPGGGVKTIAPASALPTITGPVAIDGYSQPGAKPNSLPAGNDAILKIELSGQGAGLGVSGLKVEAANSTVRGLVINRWLGEGITISGSAATGNKVTGNYVGTDASGTKDLGNSGGGVSVYYAANNTVGGTTTGTRNVISGNDQRGVSVEGAGGNKVTGNYIGTGKNGTAPLGNSSDGVSIYEAPNNIIGSAPAGARNVISANIGHGVRIYGNNATGNKVLGNFVGTNASGTQDRGNDSNGVYIDNAPNNVVGGTTAGERNIISGNTGDGVQIYGNNASGNKVVGNYVGTDVSGTKDLGNGYLGVYVWQAPNNAIGGTQAGERNVISGNNDEGVVILGDSATGNSILSNSIYANGGLGIDLEGGTKNANGPTPNDPGDTDTGSNDLQNKPALSSARTSATSTTVRGTLNSTPNKTFLIQFFSNPSGEEGKTFRGQKNVTTDVSGNATFTFTTVGKVGVGGTMTATATGAGNTSEFSAPRRVIAQ